MISKLICFLSRHWFKKVKTEDYGHESIEYQIVYFRCIICGKKKEVREDW